jgi:aspartate aminotransferase
MPFSSEALGVKESPMVQIATVAENMPGSLKLCYGESDVSTPQFICDAATEAMRAGHTFYTHTAGAMELREAIAAKVYDLHRIRYAPQEIIATVGATAAIYTVVRAFMGHGDNAVVISPSYALFTNAVVMSGGEARPVPLERRGNRFVLDLDRVQRAMDKRTRLLIVNSPSNPTGWVISVEEQLALCELAERRDCVILADEVYERLVYESEIAPSFARVMPDKDRVVVVNSFSKNYNMTGWRLGWAQASERTIKVMYRAAEFITSNTAAMVQQAGIVALRDGEAHLSDLRAHYHARRRQVKESLSKLAGVSLCEPDGAFYGFFSVERLTDSTEFTSRLLNATGVALTPGAAFGESGEGYVRLCFAASEQTVTEALARFERFMAAYPASTRG